MSTLTFSVLLWLGSIAAGLLGAMTGLGGGIVLIPFLTLVLGVDIRYAIGASLVSIIAVSSGSTAAFLRQGFTNLKVGMLLELATAVGAVGGAYLAGLFSPTWLQVIFGLVLLVTVALTSRARTENGGEPSADRLAQQLGLASSYPQDGVHVAYDVHGVGLAGFVMLGAGALSGLLGIGAGAFKVLAMDKIMRLPFKVSTTTSNFMMGVTAAASAGVYLSRGYIHPAIAVPVLLGTLPGALVGSAVLGKARTGWLRLVFTIVVAIMALRMIYEGVTGGG